jgi:hypothetical protein
MWQGDGSVASPYAEIWAQNRFSGSIVNFAEFATWRRIVIAAAAYWSCVMTGRQRATHLPSRAGHGRRAAQKRKNNCRRRNFRPTCDFEQSTKFEFRDQFESRAGHRRGKKARRLPIAYHRFAMGL